MTQSAADAASLVRALLAELTAASKSGRAVFLRGPDREATDRIIRAFVHEARGVNGRLRTAIASAADPVTPAWRQLSLRLTRRHRTGAALRRSAREWAGLLPVLGPVIGAILDTVAELRDLPAPQAGAAGTGSSIDEVRQILAHGSTELRVIVLTDCEAADHAELSGTFALIQQISRTRTLLVVTATDGDTARLKGFADLLWEAERLGVGRRIGALHTITPDQAQLLACAAEVGTAFEVVDLARKLPFTEAQIDALLVQLARANIIILTETIERGGDLVDIYELATSTDAPRPGGSKSDARGDALDRP